MRSYSDFSNLMFISKIQIVVIKVLHMIRISGSFPAVSHLSCNLLM